MTDPSPSILVIFGAGASYDSADRAGVAGASPPPLAADLVAPEFNPIAASISACLPVIDRLRSRMTSGQAGTLEQELASLAAEADDGRPEPRQHLLAFRFYLLKVIEKRIEAWLKATSGLT